MDMNEALALLRQKCADYDQQAGMWATTEAETFARVEIGSDIVTLFLGLDASLTNGLPLPTDWMKNQSFINRGQMQACSACGTHHRNCP